MLSYKLIDCLKHKHVILYVLSIPHTHILHVRLHVCVCVCNYG